MKKHWFIVANRSGMRVFEQRGLEPHAHLIETLDNPDGKLQVRELVSDQPGIAEASKLYGGSAVGNEQAPKRRIEDRFAHEIRDYLDSRAHAGAYDSLCVIAEHHLLGRIRDLLGSPSRERLTFSIAKDYGYLTDNEVIERLKPLLFEREPVAAVPQTAG